MACPFADFASILDDRFAYIPGDVIVLGILEVGDLNDVVAAMAPRPVLLQSLVDGRNRLMPDQDLRRQYSGAFESYRSSSWRSSVCQARRKTS